jgi:hypothetical protein
VSTDDEILSPPEVLRLAPDLPRERAKPIPALVHLCHSKQMLGIVMNELGRIWRPDKMRWRAWPMRWVIRGGAIIQDRQYRNLTCMDIAQVTMCGPSYVRNIFRVYQLSTDVDWQKFLTGAMTWRALLAKRSPYGPIYRKEVALYSSMGRDSKGNKKLTIERLPCRGCGDMPRIQFMPGRGACVWCNNHGRKGRHWCPEFVERQDRTWYINHHDAIAAWNIKQR